MFTISINFPNFCLSWLKLDVKIFYLGKKESFSASMLKAFKILRIFFYSSYFRENPYNALWKALIVN